MWELEYKINYKHYNSLFFFNCPPPKHEKEQSHLLFDRVIIHKVKSASLATIRPETCTEFILHPQVQSSSYSSFPSNQFTICASLHLLPKTGKETVVAVWVLGAK